MVQDSRVQVRLQDWGKECSIRMGSEGNYHPCLTGEEMKDSEPPKHASRNGALLSGSLFSAFPAVLCLISVCSALPGL